MAARGVLLTYEAEHSCCRKFGQAYANQPRHRRPKPIDKWHVNHVNKVFLTIYGEHHYLRRAVDQDDHVIDILEQRR
jgi:putative transposase